MQLTGQTVTLGDVYACADDGGYLDSGSGRFNITSSTTDYAGTMASVSGATGANEVDFHGKFWFGGGIAGSAHVALGDGIRGELIFNDVDNQRLWSESSLIVINGTNLSEDNPAYALVPSGGGAVGMVDGVGNSLGFHLHVEACSPVSGSGEVSLADWEAGTRAINLVFYGPIELAGQDYHVTLQYYNEYSQSWITAPIYYATPSDPLAYQLTSSGSNTSLNVLQITAAGSSGCSCSFLLGHNTALLRTRGD